MWLFTTIGFYSVVRSPRPGHVQIRARTRKDLQRLLRRAGPSRLTYQILPTPLADYPFRIVVPTAIWTGWLATLAPDAETYSNFKNTVASRDPVRARLYADVWLLLRKLQRP